MSVEDFEAYGEGYAEVAEEVAEVVTAPSRSSRRRKQQPKDLQPKDLQVEYERLCDARVVASRRLDAAVIAFTITSELHSNAQAELAAAEDALFAAVDQARAVLLTLARHQNSLEPSE